MHAGHVPVGVLCMSIIPQGKKTIRVKTSTHDPYRQSASSHSTCWCSSAVILLPFDLYLQATAYTLTRDVYASAIINLLA